MTSQATATKPNEKRNARDSSIEQRSNKILNIDQCTLFLPLLMKQIVTFPSWGRRYYFFQFL
jgi:hypothetical protein